MSPPKPRSRRSASPRTGSSSRPTVRACGWKRRRSVSTATRRGRWRWRAPCGNGSNRQGSESRRSDADGWENPWRAGASEAHDRGLLRKEGKRPGSPRGGRRAGPGAGSRRSAGADCCLGREAHRHQGAQRLQGQYGDAVPAGDSAPGWRGDHRPRRSWGPPRARRRASLALRGAVAKTVRECRAIRHRATGAGGAAARRRFLRGGRLPRNPCHYCPCLPLLGRRYRRQDGPGGWGDGRGGLLRAAACASGGGARLRHRRVFRARVGGARRGSRRRARPPRLRPEPAHSQADRRTRRGPHRRSRVRRNLPLDAEVLAPGGVIAAFASDADPEPLLPFRKLLLKNATLRFVLVYLVSAEAHRLAVADLTANLRQRRLRHSIALSEIAAAHEAMEAGHLNGKVIVTL